MAVCSTEGETYGGRETATKTSPTGRASKPTTGAAVKTVQPGDAAPWRVRHGSSGERVFAPPMEVLERLEPGGQASRSMRIENYLGFPTACSTMSGLAPCCLRCLTKRWRA